MTPFLYHSLISYFLVNLSLYFLFFSSVTSEKVISDLNPLIGDGIDVEEAEALRQSPFRLATSNGLSITGTVEVTEDDNVFYAFRGLRYAEAPLQKQRFQRSKLTWEQLPHASNGPACPQDFAGDLNMSEDCLWLNVFTPELSHLENPSLEAKYDVGAGYLHEHKFSKHAVMVYFHSAGTDWKSGWAGNYEPSYLLDTEIVLVTVNYRIGLFGFYNSNIGLWDQTLALKWVHEYIDTFGGDNSRVTILGHGSGASAAHFHILSSTEQLFQSVISMSGSAFNWWALSSKKDNGKKALEQKYGCSDASCLQNISFEELIAETRNISFGPVVDGDFLLKDPVKILQSGAFKQCSWLVGLASDEGHDMAKSLLDSEESKNLEKFSERILGYQSPHWTAIKTKYLGDEISLSKLSHLMSDSWFNMGVDESVRLMSQYSEGPVFYYRLHQPNETNQQIPLSHGQELHLLFPFERTTGMDHSFRGIFLRMLSDFVRFGHPTKNAWNRQHLHGTYWRHYQPHKRQFIVLSPSKIQMKVNLFDEAFQFWKNLNSKTEL